MISKEEVFDLEVLTPCRAEPARAALSIFEQLGKLEVWRTRGHWELGLPLEDARTLARALNDAGGSALVLPAQYREPKLSLSAARALAEKRLVESGCGGGFTRSTSRRSEKGASLAACSLISISSMDMSRRQTMPSNMLAGSSSSVARSRRVSRVFGGVRAARRRSADRGARLLARSCSCVRH